VGDLVQSQENQPHTPLYFGSGHSIPRAICKFQFSSKSAERLLSYEGSKSGSPRYFGHWLIQQPALPYRRDI